MRPRFLSRMRVLTPWSASSRSCVFRTAWPPRRDVARVAPGTPAVAAWAPIDHARGYQILVDVAVRQCGRAAADVLAARSSLAIKSSSPSSLPTAASRGQRSPSTRVRSGPSVQEFIRIEVKGSPRAEMLSDDVMRSLAAESEDALVEFVVPSGEIVMPMDAHIVTASKGHPAGHRAGEEQRCHPVLPKRALSCRVATSISGNASARTRRAQPPSRGRGRRRTWHPATPSARRE